MMIKPATPPMTPPMIAPVVSELADEDVGDAMLHCSFNPGHDNAAPGDPQTATTENVDESAFGQA
jgi:hypothetical protein